MEEPKALSSPAGGVQPAHVTSSSFVDGRIIATFKIDGIDKSIAGPVSGNALYEKAGNPPFLLDGTKIIPKTWKAYMVAPDTNLITSQVEPPAEKPAEPVETSPK